MKGKKPKPTALKVLQGNPGHRPLNKNEPKPKVSNYDPPEFLDGEAVEIWKQEAPRLISLGILTETDRLIFGALCEKVANWLHYSRKMHEAPDLVKSNAGNIVPNPYIRLANHAYQDMCKVAVEFGLTPVSRSRVNASEVDAEGNPWSHFRLVE